MKSRKKLNLNCIDIGRDSNTLCDTIIILVKNRETGQENQN